MPVPTESSSVLDITYVNCDELLAEAFAAMLRRALLTAYLSQSHISVRA